MSRGLFITFEGGEGAGKSTQVDRLARVFRDAGHSVMASREPGGTPIGAYLRTLLLTEQMPPKTEALLYLADRAAHVANVIRPALERGEVVISDRYADSSTVYQGYARELGMYPLADMSTWATDGLDPDLVILLDVDPAVGLARAGQHGSLDRIEREPTEFHQRIRAGFLRLAEVRNSHHRINPKLTRYAVIDASQPVDVVADQVKAAAQELLFEWVRGVPERSNA